jgi:large subunit ribosomal protein L4
MRRLSTVSTLSDKVREGDLILVDELALEQPKTRDLVAVLDALGARVPTLLVADHADSALLQAARNIQRIKTLPPTLLNTLDLLNHRTVVMTVGAARKAEETFAGARRRRRGQAREAA